MQIKTKYDIGQKVYFLTAFIISAVFFAIVRTKNSALTELDRIKEILTLKEQI